MKVICVDDEPLVLQDNRRLLSGFEEITDIQCFEYANDAMAYLNENSADIAFLDIKMPGIGGIELAKEMKFMYPRMNIIFITGYSDHAMEAIKAHAVGYLLKPVLEESIREQLDYIKMTALPSADAQLHVVTFGNFEVMKDGKAIEFVSAKAKELLAYLIDRRGSAVTASEAAAVIFEDSKNEMTAKSNVRHAFLDLRRTLASAGREDMLIKRRGCVSVDTSCVDCDYYKMIKGDAEAINSFTGEYMSQYSWAEITLAGLLNK